jgi:hypothetical protein
MAGDRQSCCFGKKNSLMKRKFEVVLCRDATVSSFVAKVCAEVFSCFHAVTMKRPCSMEIDCLACQDKFFVNNRLAMRENNEHSLDFALHQSRFFRPRLVWAFFPERLFYHCQGLHRNFPERCTKFDAHLLSNYREITSGQLHYSE